MKLTFRFVLLVVVLLLSVGASVGAGWQALSRLDAAMHRVVEQDMERVFAITHTRRLFRSMVVLERDYILSTSQEERDGMTKKMATNAKDLEEQIDKYARLMPAEDKKAIEDIRGARTRWIERDEGVRKAALSSQKEALALAKLHGKDPVSWEKVIGGLVTLSEKRLATQVKETNVVHQRAKRTLLIVSGIAALFAAAFGAVIFMGIRRNLREVQDLNANLENLVKVRTEALAQRERSLRLVLDSTGDGILGVRADGTLTGETSAAAQNWFGPATSGKSVAAYLFPHSEERQLHFRAAFDQLLEDILPWELCVEQMPRRVERGDQVLELEYKIVSGDEGGSRILVIARDVTARVRSEKTEENAREQQGLIAKLLQDKLGFSSFVKDCEELIQTLTDSKDISASRRDLHTLKGNVAIYGLASVASLCHHIEDKLEEQQSPPSAADIADLASLFRGKLSSIEAFLDNVGRDVLQVEGIEHNALVDSLLQRRDYQEILKLVEVWSWYKTSERLVRLRAQADYVAKRLQKDIDVSIQHNDLRLPPGYLEKVWLTLVHVVRNAVDHGVEPAGVRAEAGKPERATIRLTTYQTEQSFVLEIADDGPGINREALLQAAAARGVAVPSNASLVDLVFTEGLSSREQVSEISGRGVGMSAVLAACVAEDGQVEITSEPGKGTLFAFSFRRPVVKAGNLAAKLERRWSLLPPNEASMTMRAVPKPNVSTGT